MAEVDLIVPLERLLSFSPALTVAFGRQAVLLAHALGEGLLRLIPQHHNLSPR